MLSFQFGVGNYLNLNMCYEASHSVSHHDPKHWISFQKKSLFVSQVEFMHTNDSVILWNLT